MNKKSSRIIFETFFLCLLFFANYLKTVQSVSSKGKNYPSLRNYTLAEIREYLHGEIWTTYQGGVYNLTQFGNLHPDDEKISLVIGGDLEPLLSFYTVSEQREILKFLNGSRIGNLVENEHAASELDVQKDPFAKDPGRHPALLVCSAKPFNAATPPILLTEQFLTPNEFFFVRNHLPVPHVDIDKYELEVGGKDMKSQKYKLNDLKSTFKSVKIISTIQCAGNRRGEMNKVKPVKGVIWPATAISNAEWTGVRLRDVLIASGIEKSKANLQHVQFEGLDVNVTSPKNDTSHRYGASIEYDKAMDINGDVIIAYEMNGKPLPLDHGFPLRIVAPGIVGARNVKWLSKIFVSDQESQTNWQQNDYKSFSPSVDSANLDYKTAPAIQELPVQSAICYPSFNQTISNGSKVLKVKGYAWSGGGRGIIRVDVSADGGKTWHTADSNHSADQKLTRSWAWTLWSCRIPLPHTAASSVELVAKATDISYNSQPDSIVGIWNLRGVLNNAWHRVSISLT